MLISFPGEPDDIGLKPGDVMWGDGELTGLLSGLPQLGLLLHVTNNKNNHKTL